MNSDPTVPAAKVLVSAHCYLNPGEADRMRVGDLAEPAAGGHLSPQSYGLIVAPQERLEPIKTQTFDGTVIVDSV